MLECCTLGTGGALPLPDRALASLYVRVNGHGLLIDCGEGTQVGIRRLGWGFRCGLFCHDFICLRCSLGNIFRYGLICFR